MGPLQTVDLIDVGYCMYMYVPVNAEKNLKPVYVIIT
jgi:hypothetical protein